MTTESISFFDMELFKKSLKKQNYLLFEKQLTAKELTLSEYFSHCNDFPTQTPTLAELTGYMVWATNINKNLAYQSLVYGILGRLIKKLKEEQAGEAHE